MKALLKMVGGSSRSPFVAPLWIYTLLALLLTWPLLRHFTTHVPGDGTDDPALAWNLWWIKARLVDQLNLDIFHCDWMFHPVQINLAFYTLTPLNGLLSLPLQTAFTLIVANNLILLASFVLSGYGTYLLVTDLLQTAHVGRRDPFDSAFRTPHSAFLSGLIYAFASAKLFYVSLGQFNIASSQWIPFCVLYLLRMGRSQDVRAARRYAAMAGLFLVLQAWAELTYASFLLLFIAGYCLWLLIANLPRAKLSHTLGNRQHLSHFALLGLIFLLGIAPFLWAMLPDLQAEGDFFTSGGGFADTFSADLLGYLLPTRLHPLLGSWAASLPFPNDKGQQIYLGYTVLLLIASGVASQFRLHSSSFRLHPFFWFANAFLFWLLTLGPQFRWQGRALPIPGPFTLVSQLPFFSGNRYPSRYSVMLLLCVAVLAGYALYGLMSVLPRLKTEDWHGQRLPNLQSLFFYLISTLFLFEQLSLPLPLSDFRVPAIYRTLAAQPGDFAVLELPTGWRNGARVLGKSDKLIMLQEWYQTVHGKRRLGGNTSRNPPGKFQYYSAAPLLGDLIALMNADRAHIQPVVAAEYNALVQRNQPIAGQVLAFLGVKFVTVHVEKSPPALLRFVDDVLPLTLVEEWRGQEATGAANTIRLYAVQPNAPASPPATSWEIDLAQPTSTLYLADGWSAFASAQVGVRYATRPQADVLLPFALHNQPLRVDLPGSSTVVIQHDPDRLRLQFGNRPTPVDQFSSPGGSGNLIGSTGVHAPVSIVAQSAGEEVGDFAHLWVNGQDWVRVSGEPAYNLVALTTDGQVAESVAFNTHGSPTASAELAAWLNRWPPGTIIAGAVGDETSLRLGEDAVNALHRLGVAGDLRGKFRWSHAFIGVVGAPAGSAQEQLQLLQPATAYVGVPVDGAAIYGGVGVVRLTTK